MAKKIVLLSDGTGNSAAKVWRTNVWRLFESLDLSGPDQIAFYDDGVGTSSFLPLAILGGAFGWGLKRNVLDLYKFLCRNYSSADDEIFAFGFSRGAFTIRVVIGLVVNQGLVTFSSEEELDRKIRAAYRAFRTQKFKSRLGIEKPFRWLRRLFLPASHDATERPVKKIQFLGLWDTVAAYGLPVEEMTRGISRYLFPLELPDRELDPKVFRARHALSLDDERTTFHPVLWDESKETVLPADPKTQERLIKDERISQVWFAGVHANVGGGYPDDSLAEVPLNWIMDEAQTWGLRFKRAPKADPDAIVHAKSAEDKDGRLYDSRSGLGGYYRYGPRKLADLCKITLSDDPRDHVVVETPKIHEAVFERIKNAAHLYAPIGLPRKYEVVKANGSIVLSTVYESSVVTDARCQMQEAVWNLVWRRRSIYFLTVFASLYLATYPLYHKVNSVGEFKTSLRYVSDTIRIIGSFSPSTLEPWLNAYAREPGWFLLIAAIVAFLIKVGSNLGYEITDRMNSIWSVGLRARPGQAIANAQWPSVSYIVRFVILVAVYTVIYRWLSGPLGLNTSSPLSGFGILDYYGGSPVSGIATVFLIAMLLPASWIFRLRRCAGYKKTLSVLKLTVAPALFAVMFVYIGAAFASHLLFTTEDAYGLACPGSPHLKQMKYCSMPTIAWCDSANHPQCQNSGVKAACQIGTPTCTGSTVAMCGNIPAVTAVPAVPAVCPRPCNDDDDVITLTVPFDISNVCFPTQVKVEKSQTYLITISQREPRWYAFRGAIETNAGGFRISDLNSPFKKAYMLLLWPLKRSFIRPWFAVVARTGSTGNDEDFLDPDDDGRPGQKIVLQEKFKPHQDGELFLYVNDAVIAGASLKNLVRYFDFFYKKSIGTADVKIERIPN